MAELDIFNRKRKNWMRCIVKDMTNFHIIRDGWMDGWVTTAVEGATGWSTSVDVEAESSIKERSRNEAEMAATQRVKVVGM